MLTTIKLYGSLRRFGKTFQFDIDRVGEAISALDANLAGFREYLIKHSDSGYRVLIDNTPIMELDEFGFAVTVPRTIKIVPVVSGSGKGIGQIILGVGLLALAFVPGVGTAIAGGLATMGIDVAAGSIALQIGFMGFSMAAGGVMQLLSPIPSQRNSKNADNKSFASGIATIQQGQRIPIAYGKCFVEPQPISVKLTVENGNY